jgi:hypothetical protein
MAKYQTLCQNGLATINPCALRDLPIDGIYAVGFVRFFAYTPEAKTLTIGNSIASLERTFAEPGCLRVSLALLTR